jgi:hypothetical protein
MYRLFQPSLTANPTVILSMIPIIVGLTGTLITTIAAYASSTSNFNNTTVIIPTAESVYQSEVNEASSICRILYNIDTK